MIPTASAGSKNRRRWELTLGAIPKENAKALTTCVAAALAGRTDWPEELAAEPTIALYLRTLANDNENSPLLAGFPKTGDALIEAYYRHQKSKYKSSWPETARLYNQRLMDFVQDPERINARTVAAFFDSTAEMKNSRHKKDANGEIRSLKNATRNRMRTAASGLFSWMRKIGMRPRSWQPISGTELLREDPPYDNIVIWETNEIPPLLASANDMRDGIALWIALYSGMRRSEIHRLEWNDISDTVITVRKSKTGKQRQIPLANKLGERLAALPRAGDRVVSWPESYYGFIAAARDLIGYKLQNRLSELHKAHPEKFDWNPLRHTFASRLAQAGHSLDLISAWLGDSPKVCREHYARFVPANKRDTRIDDINI